MQAPETSRPAPTRKLSTEEIKRALRKLTPEERAEVEALMLFSGRWKPLPGPQTAAYDSDADILGYGGAAGGGKTDLVLGKALTKHHRSLILRRTSPQLTGIWERSKELFAEYGASKESPIKMWRTRFGGRPQIIEMASCQHESDKNDYQGRPHDLIAFDETTHFSETQVTYIIGWLRHEDARQKCQVILPSNPPEDDVTGDWYFRWFAAWLDEKHPNPAKFGEIRWMVVLDGKGQEWPDGRHFLPVDGKPQYDFDHDLYRTEPEKIIRPRSITFIQSFIRDNPFYANGDYIKTLQAMPEPYRSRLLYGDFTVGRSDQERQVIPTAWVRAAQERWKNTPAPGYKMSAIGVDVARGGKDKTVYTPRHRNWFAPQIVKPGRDTPDGAEVRDDVLEIERDGCRVNIDVIGVGSSPYDMCRHHKKIGRRAVAINGAEGTDDMDKSGKLYFKNKRARDHWKLREALDPITGDALMIPDDPELRADLCAATWKPTAQGIQVEAKDDIKARLGRSPDKGESLIYAHSEEDAPMQVSDDALAILARPART